ncbi:MAG TPA: hypothetical protein VI792_01840 [Candidatus Eisenbacteria bacterium]
MNQHHLTSNRPGDKPSMGMGSRALVGAILVAALAAAGAAGCGKGKTESTPTAEVVSQERVVDPPAHAAQTTPDSAQSAALGGESAASRMSDAMPPEIAVTAPDSVLAPGTIVEITARGTADVVGMSLRDHLGREQAFALDPESKIWRARYRVPLRVSGDHLALSVTARNGAGQWRRAWVSLAVSSASE